MYNWITLLVSCGPETSIANNYISVKIKRQEIFTQTSKMKLKSTDVKPLVKVQEVIYSE